MKTRSAANMLPATRKLAILLVITVLVMVPLACTGGFIYPAEMTATAQAPIQTYISGVSEQAAIVAPSPSPSPTSTEQPSPSPTQAIASSETPTEIADLPVVLSEPTPIESQPEAEHTPIPDQSSPILYYTQAGDTLKGLAARFNVQPEEITSPKKIPDEGLFDPGILLLIPPRLGEVSSSIPLIPDSEIVYSPSALEFKMEEFIEQSSGYLMSYKEWRSNGWHDGIQVIERVAIENSINPRLLLAILEFQSHWVYDQPQNLAETDFPIGWLRVENEKKGLYYQLSWAVQQLNIGYYGWRDGTITSLTFPDEETTLRLAPDLNAGTVAILYLFSRLYNQPEWAGILYGSDGIMQLYEDMFGNPWIRAQTVEPLFPATLTQPPLELPFPENQTWSYTGGPHSAWGPDGARAALDFAPSTVNHGCYESTDWVTASASGLVVRSGNGVVVLDLDGDGYEQTGWSILYLHIDSDDRVPLGAWVDQDGKIGHPSCEGGMATGTHVHMARKYNGEWILADGPMPFVLSGWRAHADAELYKGSLTRGAQTAYASTVGSFESLVKRPQ